MRAFVHDPSQGLGGGQRWSRQFAAWLRGRGHDVVFSADPIPLVGRVDVFFDMAPVGDTSLYPKGAKVFLWWHAPRSLRHSEAVDRATVIASSEWSAESYRTCWRKDARVLPLFTNANGGSGIRGILFFGRLTRPKGLHAAIRLAQRVDEPVTLAGATWSSKDEDKRAATACGARMDPTDEEADALYGTHKIFWQLSGMDAGPPEGFGLAAADALSRGMLVIGFRAGAIQEWLPERFLVDDEADVILRTRAALAGDVSPATTEEVARVRKSAFEARVGELGLPW